ncbi:MAG: hypothetical protein ACI8T1_005245 [Verrucomicrobiales bacterium]|jgi:hypothetical protein
MAYQWKDHDRLASSRQDADSTRDHRHWKRLVKAIRERFPKTIITFRADSHHTKPAVMDFVEEQDVEFITGLATNKALERAFSLKTSRKPKSATSVARTMTKRPKSSSFYADELLRGWRLEQRATRDRTHHRGATGRGCALCGDVL